MSQIAQTAAEKALADQAETRIAARLLALVAVVLVALAASIYLWGLPALTIFGLFMTAVMMIGLLAYAAGY